MHELALFAGAGGGILGSLLLGHRIVGAVELDGRLRERLLRRQRDGVLPVFPIWDDIRTFDGRPWRGHVDCVSAGFPCQPFSAAGKRRGAADNRNLWPDTIRVIREVQPCYAFLENVPGIISCGYIDTVLGDLRKAGLSCLPPLILGADDIGANHRRKRVWILAYAAGLLGEAIERDEPHGTLPQDVAYTIGTGGIRAKAGRSQQGADGWPRDNSEDDVPIPAGQRWGPGALGANPSADEQAPPLRASWWAAEPGVGGVAHGVAHRVDRLRALGNGQVPAVVREAWLRLTDRIGKP